MIHRLGKGLERVALAAGEGLGEGLRSQKFHYGGSHYIVSLDGLMEEGKLRFVATYQNGVPLHVYKRISVQAA